MADAIRSSAAATVTPTRGGITAPRGFRTGAVHCGIKKSPSALDLAVLAADAAGSAAGLFTTNLAQAAPVTVSKEHLDRTTGRARAVVVNSGCANACTGDTGMQHARQMAAETAAALGCAPEEILVASTGVIGVALPIDRVIAGIRSATGSMSADAGADAARAIMTTDPFPKDYAVTVTTSRGTFTIGGMAKGSGMIEPNMATMLVYIFTDAQFDAATLDAMLRRAVEVSFNMLSIDTDTSTSDTCALLANGLAGAVDATAFEATLTAGCIRMAQTIARDGEGAKHLITVTVRGAKTTPEARTIAKSVVNSPLVKTMVAGADPNVGRLLMAIGKCFDVTIDRSKTDAWINGYPVVVGGTRGTFDDAVVRATLSVEVVTIEIALAVGSGEATAFGCDLTEGYIKENAAYYSS